MPRAFFHLLESTAQQYKIVGKTKYESARKVEELLRKTLQALEKGRKIMKALPPSSFTELKNAWQHHVRRKPLPPISPIVAEAVKYAAEHGFNVTNSHAAKGVEHAKPSSFYDPDVTPGTKYRPFTVASKPYNVILRVQRQVFKRVFDRTKGVFVYPAMGFDGDCVPPEAKFVDISPDGPPLPPFHAIAEIEYVKKKAEEASAEEIEAAKRKLGNFTNTVLVLKGIQSILSQRELASLIDRVSPTHVMAMETPATGFTGKPVGFPAITKELVQTLERKGFAEKTGDYFSVKERELLEDIHALARDHFAWASGHFPAVRVKIWERKTK